MTPDAAEKAGVPVVAYRTDIFESLPNGKLSRLIMEASEVKDPDPDWTPLVPAAALDTARAEIERLRALADRLKLEAQAHAQEARTANSTIYEIYQVLSGSTGEPGNWNGAEPARQFVTAAQERIAELEGLVEQAETIFTHCTVSDGVCCCGDSMENHADPMWCGHSPVDHGGYVADGWLAKARATFSPAVKENDRG